MKDALGPAAIIGVVGAGAMGSGIAQVAAAAGHSVLLLDARPGVAAEATEQIAGRFNAAAAKGRMTLAEAAAGRQRVAPASDIGELTDCALVIEAIVEDLGTKQALFRDLEHVLKPDAILASNTSSLSITALGAGLRWPRRVIGMHFFNPAPVMALVEVVSGLATDAGVADIVTATAAAWGKTPVRCRSTPGFIVNRVARPFYGEAMRLLADNAADAATIDAVLREAGGFRMGPFELTDLIGQDINYAVTRSVYDAYEQDPRYRPSLRQRELVEAGRLGRKTGCGFFDYAPGASVAKPTSEPRRAPPTSVRVEGDLGPLEPFLSRIASAGVHVARTDGAGRIVIEDLTLRLVNGQSATSRGAALGERLIHVDVALDYSTCSRLAIAAALQVEDVGPAVGLLQAAGCEVSTIRDTAGLVVLRTVAMLANEAIEAVQQGVAVPEAIDTAMCKGVNYPRGPLNWAACLGLARILDTMDGLSATYGEDRYRASPMLRDLVAAERLVVELP